MTVPSTQATATRHSLRRTSPKGQVFVGTCVLCGTPNLMTADMGEECPNQRAISQDDALIEAITWQASPC